MRKTAIRLGGHSTLILRSKSYGGKKRLGARGKTGTRAFMAIGVLLDKKHSFRHDLESFFWVLFWICVHYSSPNEESRVVPRFEKWNYWKKSAFQSDHQSAPSSAHCHPHFQL